MAWKVKGTYFENCSCEVLCPCIYSSFALPATHDRCQVLLAFHVEQGEADGTDLSDRTVAILADTPAMMAEGNWRVGVFMDDRASAEQAEKLGAVFSGQLGGPPAMFAGLTGELLGVVQAKIDYSDDGNHHRLRIGDDVDLEVEDYANPAGEALTITNTIHPANSTLTIAHSVRSKINGFGLSLQNEGRNAHSSPFEWSG